MVFARRSAEDSRSSDSSVSGERPSSSDRDVETQMKRSEKEAVATDDTTKTEDGLELVGAKVEDPSERTTGGLTAVLSRVVSRASTRTNLGPPPDGGAKAWTTGRFHPSN